MQDTDRKLLIPALRTTLQVKRIQLDQVEFSIKEQTRIENRAFEEGRNAAKVRVEKQKLVLSIQEEVEALERMIKEYSK